MVISFYIFFYIFLHFNRRLFIDTFINNHFYFKCNNPERVPTSPFTNVLNDILIRV